MTSRPRTQLPLTPIGTRHGNRSYATCRYRCGDACDQPIPNPTDHPHLRDEITKVVQRRAVLRGGALGAGALLVGGFAGAAAAEGPPAGRTGDLGRVGFTPVKPNVRDAVVVPDGFRHDVLIRWGDPVLPGAPAFDVRAQTPAAAAAQFGYNNDYVGLLELRDGKHALLVVNHEYTNPELMFPANGYDAETKTRIEMMSHGMSVVTLRRGRTPGAWLRVNPRRAPKNRRITADTPFEVTGPAAGHPRLRTSADPSGRTVLGTLNNCAGGMTPWGTVLSGEENFNQYFDVPGPVDPKYAESYARYGINGQRTRNWSAVDPRFDVSQEPHEPFRFGWIVEVDPTRPRSRPIKRTMLGRFKHEGANIAIARNKRVVAYMGDDERGDYLYRFVSRDKYDDSGTARARRHNLTLLDHGTLYVARLTGDGTGDGEFDGTGEWIPLTSDTTSFVDGMGVAEVLIDTRLAADTVAPTKMDRPEDVEPNPVNGKVYAALTNNSDRGTRYPGDEANPLERSHVRSGPGAPLTETSGNRNGYVLEMTPRNGNHTHRRFDWNLMLVCGDPAAQETYFAGFDKADVSPISCPDNVAFDEAGNLWISTDGNVIGSNDGIFRVPVAGPRRGQVLQFATMPRGAEACGPLLADRSRSLFFAVQHPGEGGAFDQPTSTWPHSDEFPRPAVAVAYRKR